MGKSLTQKEFLSLCKAMHKDKYNYSKTVYVNARSMVTVTCKQHGDFEQRAYSHLSGMGCRRCGSEGKMVPLKHSTKEYVSLAKEKHGGRYTYARLKYEGTNGKVLITCKQHGDFEQRASSHLSGQGCPECANKDRRSKTTLSTYAFVQKANAVHGDLYEYSKVVYRHHDQKVSIVCHKHGTFKQTPANHANQKQGCPECGVEKNLRSYGNGSVIERRVFGWLKKHVAVERNNRTVLAPKEIDLWCISHKTGIEVHGSYWHRSELKCKTYHYDKAKLAKKAGIDLLQFWDHELIRKPNICKSMILSRLGQNSSIGARQCYLRELTISEQRSFFDDNHLQGYAYASVAYGLVTEDGIQAAMSFCKPRFNKAYDWEIIRYANRLNTSVSGGASKIWKHFVASHQPQNVITYADLRYSVGGLYKTLGFKFLRSTPPGYFYCKASEVISRFAAQKSKLPKLLGAKFVSTLSEHDNMKACGWYKVYDAGNLVLVWEV